MLGKVLCLYLWAWIGGDKGGNSVSFIVKAKQNEALFYRVNDQFDETDISPFNEDEDNLQKCKKS